MSSKDPSTLGLGLGLALSHVLAWVGVALVNAAFAFAIPWPALGASVRVTHLAYVAGQALAVGMLGWLLLHRLPRFDRPSRVWVWTCAGLAALSVWVSQSTLAPDIDHFMDARGWADLRDPVAGVLGLGIPAAALVGHVLARPRWRWAAALAAVVALAGNQQILQGGYPGAHLYVTWAAATLASWALVGASLPAWVGRLRARRAVALPVTIAASLAGAASIAVWPSPAVVVDVFQNEGAVLFPFLAQVRAEIEEDELEEIDEIEDQPPPKDGVATKAPTGVGPWMKPRTDVPDIPPSTPSLAPERPIVIMLTIDAMRAEALNDPAISSRLPRMRAIADAAVSFTEARSACSSTRCSFGTMFASKHWSALNWSSRRKGKHLRNDKTPRLTNMLGEAGLTTVNVVSYGALGPKTRALGTFSEMHVVKAGTEGQRFPLAHEMLDVALPVIEDHKNDSLFLVMHWMDAHEPYDAGGDEGPVRERYIRELEVVDTQVGRLWDSLERMGVLDRVVLVLSADHGEGLGEHGVPHHGVSLYDVLVRVPLVIRVPGVGPRRVTTPVSTLDIAPTLTDLLGHPTPGRWMGQSLVGFLRGESPLLERPIVGDQDKVVSMVIDGKKIMEDRRKHVLEIYDLATDPDEQRNLAGALGDEEKRLVRRLRKFFRNHRVVGEDSGTVD